MTGIIERLDPESWIDEGKSLLSYPLLEPSSLQFAIIEVVFADNRKLANRLARWMARVAETHNPPTEENLRQLWEEAKTSMDDLEDGAARTMADGCVTEDGFAFPRGWVD